jgi:hypothetical protein
VGNSYKLLVRKRDLPIQLGRTRRRFKVNVKVVLEYKVCYSELDADHSGRAV